MWTRCRCSQQLQPLLEPSPWLLLQNSISSMEEFSTSEYRPPVPVRRSIHKGQEIAASERDQWKNWVQCLQDEIDQCKQQGERYRALYEKQKVGRSVSL